jgi:hypothetical protein
MIQHAENMQYSLVAKKAHPRQENCFFFGGGGGGNRYCGNKRGAEFVIRMEVCQ